MTRCFPVDDPSRVGEIRRAAATFSEEEQLGEDAIANASLIATEISTNLVKHAQGGEVFLSTLSSRSNSGASGIEILAIDRGPGMGDLARFLKDGFSSANTAGTGLGAIARHAQEFDIFSEPGKGTVMVARIQAAGVPRTSVGVAIKPIKGEEVCGDAWAFQNEDRYLTLIVADGLGHGPLAARASGDAVKTFLRTKDFVPATVLQKVHGALRGTRGAAVAVACLDRTASTVRYAGIGNITGAVAGMEKPAMMISHNGTAGYHSPRFQEFSYALQEQPLIVMHSDGLHTGWNLSLHPGLLRRDPSVIAGVLYRECSRERDDVCVVVAKTGEYEA